MCRISSDFTFALFLFTIGSRKLSSPPRPPFLLPRFPPTLLLLCFPRFLIALFIALKRRPKLPIEETDMEIGEWWLWECTYNPFRIGMSKTRAQLLTANIGVEHFVAYIKFNFQDDGHISFAPAVHVWLHYSDLKNCHKSPIGSKNCTKCKK